MYEYFQDMFSNFRAGHLVVFVLRGHTVSVDSQVDFRKFQMDLWFRDPKQIMFWSIHRPRPEVSLFASHII